MADSIPPAPDSSEPFDPAPVDDGTGTVMGSPTGQPTGQPAGPTDAPTRTRVPDDVGTMSAGEFAGIPVAYRREGSRYEIRSRHAEGGLGVVFIAHDGELGRHVALKEMKPGMSEHHHQEFQREAEITGNLEHPGIVPVYGLGTYADGRPFYAMRFIEGENLDAAIKAHHAQPTSAGFRGLLNRFVALCNAIAYAHSRGIIHRDIKPANVMLGKFGETLVVDWGIARSVGDPDATASEDGGQSGRLTSLSDTTETLQGSVKGTPSFMSPEQAEGKIPDLGPACDIYSLGATLYVLLAGKSAFGGGSVGELLDAVKLGRFVPPRQARKESPAALSAVCCRAMSLKPEDRYPSALALAEEVERYLADEPVLAYREPFVLRARRWMRKHPGLVSAVSAAVLVGGLAVAGGLLVVRGKNAQLDAVNGDLRQTNDSLDTANGDLRQANADLEVARTLAEDRQREAVESRDLAQGRYQLALDAFNDMVFSIQNKLDERPGTQDLKKELLGKAKQGLQKLLERAEKEGRADATLMWSHLRMGDVLMTLGDSAAAAAEYKIGYERAEALAGEALESATATRNLSAALDRLGKVSLVMGRKEQARDYYQRSLALAEKLATRNPTSSRLQWDFVSSLYNVGDVLLRMEQPAAAGEYYLRSAELAERLAAAAPDDADAAWNLSVALGRVAGTLTRKREWAQADRAFARVLLIEEGLIGAMPDNLQLKRNLSITLNDLGNVWLQLGRRKEAVGLFRRSLGMVEQFAIDEPRNTSAQRLACSAMENLADVHLSLTELREAAELYSRSTAIREKIALNDPNDVGAQRGWSASLNKLGDIRLRQGQTKEAARLLGQSVALREKSAAGDPDSVAARRALCLSMNNLGKALMGAMQTAEADAMFARSLASSEALLKLDPADAAARWNLAVSLNYLGELRAAAGDSPGAEAYWLRAIPVRESIAAEQPHNLWAQRNLCATLLNLADVRMRSRRTESARELVRQAFAVRQKVVADNPDNAPSWRDLLIAYRRLGEVEESVSEWGDAECYYRKGLDVALEFVRPDELESYMKPLRQRIVWCRAAPGILADPASVESLPAADRLPVLLEAFPILIWSAPPKARVVADTFARLCESGEDTYDAACLYSRLSAKGDATRREADAAKAVALIRTAGEKGYVEPAYMKTDKDLDPLRERADYKSAIADLEKQKKKP